jgi:hypothetical protein
MKAEQLGPAKGTGEEYPGPRHQWLPECMQNSQSNARDKLQRKQKKENPVSILKLRELSCLSCSHGIHQSCPAPSKCNRHHDH